MQTVEHQILEKPSFTDEQKGQSKRPQVRIKDDLGSEVSRWCHHLDIGYRPRRLETVECPLRRTTRSECVKNTLTGKETEHRQSRWIRRRRFISNLSPSNKEDRESFADLWDQVIHAHQTSLDFCCRHLSKP